MENNQIGFLAKDWAFLFTKKMDLGMEFSAKVKEITRSFIDVEIFRTNFTITTGSVEYMPLS